MRLDAYFSSRRPPEPLGASQGDRVGWTRYHLLQTGRAPTDPVWGQQGQVLEVDRERNWALVQWDGETEPRWAALVNLAHPGPNSRWCD